MVEDERAKMEPSDVPSFIEAEWVDSPQYEEFFTIQEGRKDEVMLHIILPIATLTKLLKAKDPMESIRQFLERVLNSYQE